MSMTMTAIASRPGTSQGSYLCRPSDSLFSVIERCLENGAGACLVVDDGYLLGEITLEDIRRSILDGSALTGPTAGQQLDGAKRKLEDGSSEDAAPRSALRPIIDRDGRVNGVKLDRTPAEVKAARPRLSALEFRALLDAFLSSWISSKGSYIEGLETSFSDHVGRRHGVAVTNGTVALHLALVALGVGPDDEVVLPALASTAVINAVLQCGATPVIVDVERTTWSLGLQSVERACSPRTKAIIAVHFHGRPAEIGPLAQFALARGLALVEDCSGAVGALYDRRKIGCFGDIACFSFLPDSVVTTGEGGMLLTDSAELCQSMRLARDHGMTPGRAYWHECVGYNYRMTNLQAAIGQAQLRRIDEALARKRHLEALYRRALHNVPGLGFPPALPTSYSPAPGAGAILVSRSAQRTIVQAAHNAGIEIAPFVPSLPMLVPYFAFSRSCPHATFLSASGLVLPTSADVDEEIVQRIASLLRGVLE